MKNDALQQYLSSSKIDYEYTTWQNFCETQQVNAYIVEIHQVEELSRLIKQINSLNQSSDSKIVVRAAAGCKEKEPSCCSGLFSKNKAQHYHESFSLSPIVVAQNESNNICHVIIRFGSAFQKNKLLIEQIENHFSAYIPAGMSVGEAVNTLAKKGLSLETISMIPYVSVVGLIATGGHGTGTAHPSAAGLVEAFDIIDANGDRKMITKENPDFEALRGAHLGLFGIVVGVKMRAVPLFYLDETRTPYKNIPDLNLGLCEALKTTDYITLFHAPNYLNDTDHAYFELRQWNKTNLPLKKSNTKNHACLAFDAERFKVLIGDFAQDLATSSDNLYAIIPQITRLIAHQKIVSEKTTSSGASNQIMHPFDHFAKHLADLSFLFPTKKENPENVTRHLEKIESLLQEFAARREYPVTYTVFARFFKGTQGGLSTSACEDDEIICALEVVSHPNAPGWKNFRTQLIDYMNQAEPKVKPHLGKDLLNKTVFEIYGPEIQTQVMNAITTISETTLGNSPFLTPSLRNFLTHTSLAQKISTPTNAQKTPDEKALITFIKSINTLKGKAKDNTGVIQTLDKLKELIEIQLSPLTSPCQKSG